MREEREGREGWRKEGEGGGRKGGRERECGERGGGEERNQLNVQWSMV